MKQLIRNTIPGICVCLLLLLTVHTLHAEKSSTQKANRIEKLKKKMAGCSPASAQVDLDVNNVRTTILNGGDMWWNLSNPRYEVPKIIQSGQISKNALSAGALWIGGIVNGSLHLAAQTYRQNGNDYYPGPLSTANNGSITQSRCKDFDKIWKITLNEINQFKNDPSQWSNPVNMISSWPCHGNTSNGEAQFLAPFMDLNGNSIYEPTMGEYPTFDQNNMNTIPDQMIFFIYNDKGNIHSETQGTPVGLELQEQAFAFATSDELNNATFYRTKIINRGPETIDSCMFGQWVDGGLGNYTDDYVECDVTRNLGIFYNGDDDDDGILGYGMNPPSVGINFLEGPKGSDGNVIGLTKFISYNNDWSNTGNPQMPWHYWSYLNAKWKDGTPLTYGSNGKGGVDTCSFMFPGTTDPAGRSEWTERTVSSTPGQRRFVMSSGPFSMAPGAVNYVTIAVVWARAASGGPTGSFDLLKQASDKAYLKYKNKFNGVNDITDLSVSNNIVYPNPGNGVIQFSDLPKDVTQILVYDESGRLCLKKSIKEQTAIETTLLSNGVYHYQLLNASDEVLKTGKWIKK